MPSFNYTVIYEAVTSPVAIVSEDFAGGAAEYITPVIRRIPYQFTPTLTSDEVIVVADDEDTAFSDTPVIRRPNYYLSTSTFDIFTAAEDFLGVPEDYATPIVFIRYPLEPSITPDLFTDAEDFLGLPENYNVPIVLKRFLFESEATNDFFQDPLDATGFAENLASPIVYRQRYNSLPPMLFDIATATEDFLGLPEDYSTPIVLKRFLFESESAIDLFQESVDIVGAAEDYSIPIVYRQRYGPLPPMLLDLFTSAEDFLGLPEVYNPFVIRHRFDYLWSDVWNTPVADEVTVVSGATLDGRAGQSVTLGGVFLKSLTVDGRATNE